VRGCDLYVTLEPCVHHGKTAPCVDALVEAGVARVFVAMADPDPRMRGRGLRRLRRAGAQVEVGLLGTRARDLNAAYLKRLRDGVPLVTIKLALSADGRIAVPGRRRVWVTGPHCRRDGHRLRDQSDAVLVGVGTIRSDDPRLTVRAGRRERGIVRVILDSRLSTPPGARVVTTAKRWPTWILTGNGASRARTERLEAAGCRVLRVAVDRAGRVRASAALRRLAREGVSALLVEGGARVVSAFLREGLADRAVFYLAPLLLGGGGAPATQDLSVVGPGSVIRLEAASWTLLADGARLEGRPRRGRPGRH